MHAPSMQQPPLSWLQLHTVCALTLSGCTGAHSMALANMHADVQTPHVQRGYRMRFRSPQPHVSVYTCCTRADCDVSFETRGRLVVSTFRGRAITPGCYREGDNGNWKGPRPPLFVALVTTASCRCGSWVHTRPAGAREFKWPLSDA